MRLEEQKGEAGGSACKLRLNLVSFLLQVTRISAISSACFPPCGALVNPEARDKKRHLEEERLNLRGQASTKWISSTRPAGKKCTCKKADETSFFLGLQA